MKNKWKKRLCLLVACVGVCALAAACGEEEAVSSDQSSNRPPVEEEVKPSFSLGADGLELELYEKYTLDYTMQEISGNVEWSSSAPDVVSVTDGALEAKAEGTAVITATVGEYSDECIVKVTNGYSIPSLSIAEKISVAKGSSTSVKASVVWKGRELDVPLSCEYESGDPNVANVSVEGGKVRAEGLAYGSATYLLTAQTHGRTLAISFEVVCMDGDVVFVVENAQPTIGGWVSEVALCDNEDGVPVSFEPEVSVYEGSEKIADAEITWTLSEETYFRESGGAYYADTLGSQTLVGSYKGNSVTITLQSVRPDFYRDEAVVLEMVEGLVAPKDIEGTIEGYYVNGVDVFESYNGVTNRISFAKTGLSDPSKMGEGSELILQTDRACYYYEGAVYTNIIETEAELNRWVEDAKAATAGTDASGYFVLGQDIVCTGDYKAQESYGFGVTATDGFQGVFDGRGYTIENLNVIGDMCGFMPMIGANGAVCNTVFKNATLSGNGGFIAAHLRGTVYNLYIDLSITENDEVAAKNSGDRRFCRSAIAPQTESSTVIRDCAVIYQTETSETAQTGHVFKCLYGKVTGMYVIGHTTQSAFSGEVYTSTNYGLFADRAEMIADLKVWNEDAHVWDSSFWTVDTDGIPVPIEK